MGKEGKEVRRDGEGGEGKYMYELNTHTVMKCRVICDHETLDKENQIINVTKQRVRGNYLEPTLAASNE